MPSALYQSPLGPIFIRADHDALLELHFIDDAISVEGNTPAPPTSPCLAQTFLWLDQYFSGNAPDFTPPFRLDLTPFSRRVLEIARRIPFGATLTYGEIAEIIAAERNLQKMSARAVGSAMRKNPICLIIPCHRVIGANRRLGGYNGNPRRKRQLLAHEGIDISRLV